jgi:hypothetical protein
MPTNYVHVIAGLDPAIQGLLAWSELPWMPGSSPGMTSIEVISNQYEPACVAG